MLRTLEGDIDITVNQDKLLIIGVNDETYPISRDDFNKNYRLTGNNYVFSEDYAPALRHYISGDQIDLSSITQECVSLGSSLVYAKQLTRRTHVFTVWDKQKYIYGKAGDWIAVRKDKPEDVYIITKEVFSKTYEKE